MPGFLFSESLFFNCGLTAYQDRGLCLLKGGIALKLRNALTPKEQAQLLTMRDAMLVAPHIEGKKGNAAYATARKILKDSGRKAKNLRRVVNLAQKV